MAEVLGTLATTAQLAGLAIKAFQGCKDIYDRIQDTPEEIVQRFNEVDDLETILTHIEECSELRTRDVAAILERCGKTSQKLCQELNEVGFASSDSLGRKTWRSIVGQTKEPGINQLFEELERIKSSLSLKIQLASLNQQRLTRLDIQNLASGDTDEDKCLRELFVTDPMKDRDDILDAKGDICPGTCEWITSTREYQDWERDSPHLLWISAPPGMGKTYMSVYLSKHLEHSAQYRIDTKVLYFFCDNKKDSRNTAVNILRGLLYQLILHQRNLIGNLVSQWKIQKSAMFQENSLSTLWRFFEDAVGRINATTIYCVIDALDECEETSLSNLLQRFRALSEGTRVSRSKLKLICLSRRFPERLTQSLSSFKKIELDTMAAEKNNIRHFISQRVHELARKKNIGPELQNYIQQEFQRKSEGTFLWVSFMVQDLENKPVWEIEKSLQSLPRGLDTIYAKLLSQIDPSRKSMVFKMLDWILVAARPLRVPELCEAINVQPTGTLCREQVCMSLIESCGHLLLIARNEDGLPRQRFSSITHDALPENGTNLANYWQLEVTFLHQSAKDYLNKIHSEGKMQLHQSVCSQLIMYLSKPGLVHRDPIEKTTLVDSPLSSYALSSWFLHFRELGDVSWIIKENEQFFGKRSAIRKNWNTGHPTDPMPLLHMASDLGLLNLAKWFLGRRHIQSRLGFRGHVNEIWGAGTPLECACLRGWQDIVRLLLDAGADPGMTHKWGGAPFNMAFYTCGRDVLRMMAATKGGRQWLMLEAENSESRALARAASEGNEEACRFLIEDCGWDVNRGNPVEAAMRNGQVDLAYILISEWHARTVNHWELIQLACCLDDDYEFERAIRLFLRDPSFDINATNYPGCNILCKLLTTTSGDGNARLRLVLQEGADTSNRNRNHQTPLHCAARCSAFFNLFQHKEAIEMMLRHGQIHINSICDLGQTPLHHYASRIASINQTSLVPDGERLGNIQACLRLLLDLGADPRARDNIGYSAIDILQSALHHNFEVDHIPEEWCQMAKEEGWDEESFIIRAYNQMVEDFIIILEMYTSAPPAEYSALTTEYSVPPAGYPIPPAGSSIPPARYLAPHAEYSAPTAKYSIPPAEYPIPSAGYHMPPDRCSIPPAGYLTSSAEYDAGYNPQSGNLNPVSRASGAGYDKIDRATFTKLTTQQASHDWP